MAFSIVKPLIILGEHGTFHCKTAYNTRGAWRALSNKHCCRGSFFNYLTISSKLSASEVDHQTPKY